MNQKLSDWASIAEIVSSVAVVVTLIFLLVELRENTAAIRSTNYQSIAARIEARQMDLATSPQLSRLVVLVQEPNGIERGSSEWAQLGFLYNSVLTAGEEAFLQYKQGFLDEEFFLARARRALTPLNNPVGRERFRQARADGTYVAEYMDWVDETFGYGSEENVVGQAAE